MNLNGSKTGLNNQEPHLHIFINTTLSIHLSIKPHTFSLSMNQQDNSISIQILQSLEELASTIGQKFDDIKKGLDAFQNKVTRIKLQNIDNNCFKNVRPESKLQDVDKKKKVRGIRAGKRPPSPQKDRFNQDLKLIFNRKEPKNINCTESIEISEDEEVFPDDNSIGLDLDFSLKDIEEEDNQEDSMETCWVNFLKEQTQRMVIFDPRASLEDYRKFLETKWKNLPLTQKRQWKHPETRRQKMHKKTENRNQASQRPLSSGIDNFLAKRAQQKKSDNVQKTIKTPGQSSSFSKQPQQKISAETLFDAIWSQKQKKEQIAQKDAEIALTSSGKRHLQQIFGL